MGLLDKMEPKKSTSRSVDLKQHPPSVEGYIEEVHQDQNVRKNFFRPSMFHGCKRANVFHYMDAPRSPQFMSGQLQRILEHGQMVHSSTQRLLALHPEIWFAPEAKIDIEVEGARIRGSCDGILIRKSDMYRWALEIKSIKTQHFKILKAVEKIEDLPDKTAEQREVIDKVQDHIDQSSIYCKLHGVWWTTLLYWDKNNQGLKEFHVPFDDERWERTKKRVRHLKSFVDQKKLPKYNSETCDVTFCAFVDQCRKHGAPV